MISIEVANDFGDRSGTEEGWKDEGKDTSVINEVIIPWNLKRSQQRQ
jgi:hypothetical protein